MLLRRWSALESGAPRPRSNVTSARYTDHAAPPKDPGPDSQSSKRRRREGCHQRVSFFWFFWPHPLTLPLPPSASLSLAISLPSTPPHSLALALALALFSRSRSLPPLRSSLSFSLIPSIPPPPSLHLSPPSHTHSPTHAASRLIALPTPSIALSLPRCSLRPPL